MPFKNIFLRVKTPTTGSLHKQVAKMLNSQRSEPNNYYKGIWSKYYLQTE